MKKLILIAILCVMFMPFVSAALLGVNRVSMDFNDVLRSGYAEDYIVASTGSIDNISLYFEAQGDIKDWISFSPNSSEGVFMNANNPGVVKVIVNPPSDARSGDYKGKILITTGPLGKQSGTMGTNIEVAFEVEVNVRVTDTEIISCSAGGFDIKDAEIGSPIEFSASVGNNGNVRIRPDFQIKVYDQQQKKVVAVLNYSSSRDILPTITDTISAKIENALDVGQYWAEINSSPCGTGAFLTFSILEKGGISDLGEFVRLENGAWAKTGEIVPINAHFRNRGSREVSAQFKGIVTLDGKIVKVISSDKIDVSPGELVQLQTFFTPDEIGQYKLSGRITYNSKLTFEKSSILNVEQGTAKEVGNAVYYIVLGIIILLIFALILLIRKKKKDKKAQKI